MVITIQDAIWDTRQDTGQVTGHDVEKKKVL